jgi:hypothetical protein
MHPMRKGGRKRSSTIRGLLITTRHSRSQQHGAASPLVIIILWRIENSLVMSVNPFGNSTLKIPGPGNINSSMLFKETMLTE